MRITVLGSGTSNGVPHIGCMMEDFARCPTGVCRKAATDPRHRRTRSSILVDLVDVSGAVNGLSILVDTSPDFHEQALRNRIKRVDAVLYTHAHADHSLGLPDLRPYSYRQGCPLDIYGSGETIGKLRETFGYVFPPYNTDAYITTVEPHVIETADGPLDLPGLEVTPIHVSHAGLEGCFGYRINDVAYVPDVHEFLPGELDKLHGLDVLIINALRKRPHPRHLSLDESIAIVEKLRPRRCYFTHMTHGIDYELDEPGLPGWMRFAYDSMQIEGK